MHTGLKWDFKNRFQGSKKAINPIRRDERVPARTHRVVEEVEATEEAEEVGGEQGEVDRRGAGHLHHHGHEAVQRVHAQSVDRKQHGCRTQPDGR